MSPTYLSESATKERPASRAFDAQRDHPHHSPTVEWQRNLGNYRTGRLLSAIASEGKSALVPGAWHPPILPHQGLGNRRMGHLLRTLVREGRSPRVMGARDATGTVQDRASRVADGNFPRKDGTEAGSPSDDRSNFSAAVGTFWRKLDRDHNEDQVTSPEELFARPLTTGMASDAYEPHADQLADKVMRIQRACACGGTCSSCQAHPEDRLQTKLVEGTNPTIGRETTPLIVFAARQYVPGTVSRRHLFAHELTQVLQQQDAGRSGVVQRQNPPNPPPKPPAPQGPKFQPNVDCIVDMTNKQMPIAPRTVTVIDYGATWCGACGPAQADLIQLCNEYKTAKPKVPVQFFLVDVSDNDVKPTEKTWPPVPTSLPGLLIFSGQFETYSNQGLTTPTKDEVKKQIDKAISCGGDPLKCAIVPKDCTLNPSAVPTGPRFKFNVNSVNWSPGEAVKIDAFAKSIAPGSKVDIVGLASSDGPDATNQILSCHRAMVAESVFLKYGLTVTSWTATGPVPGTDNKPEFRSAAVQVTAPVGPKPKPTPEPTTTGTCLPPACIVDFTISGPSTIQKDWLNKAEPDPIKRQQTADCDPSLFQIVPNPSNRSVTANTTILHVKWKKDPPPNTLSVTRNAADNTGDAPAGKAPSFASLDPTTDAAWAGNINGIPFRKKGCSTTLAAPAWCVPFCSFGQFKMVATVSWQCDNTICTNDVTTKPFTIDVQPKTP